MMRAIDFLLFLNSPNFTITERADAVSNAITDRLLLAVTDGDRLDTLVAAPKPPSLPPLPVTTA
jgi:hypothetical protein